MLCCLYPRVFIREVLQNLYLLLPLLILRHSLVVRPEGIRAALFSVIIATAFEWCWLPRVAVLSVRDTSGLVFRRDGQECFCQPSFRLFLPCASWIVVAKGIVGRCASYPNLEGHECRRVPSSTT